MDALENLIQDFLTCGGSVFVSPQFDAAWDKEASQGGSCPDFVALDFEKKHVVIVEMTTAYSLTSFFEKIRQRDSRWFQPIGKHLSAIGAITPEWRSRFLGFVRKPRLAFARSEFAEEAGVSFYPLEEAILGYAYWAKRQEGLP
jgi:hypothetical protein